MIQFDEHIFSNGWEKPPTRHADSSMSLFGTVPFLNSTFRRFGWPFWVFQTFPSSEMFRVWIEVSQFMALHATGEWDCQKKHRLRLFTRKSLWNFRENWSCETLFKMRHMYRIQVNYSYDKYIYIFDNHIAMTLSVALHFSFSYRYVSPNRAYQATKMTDPISRNFSKYMIVLGGSWEPFIWRQQTFHMTHRLDIRVSLLRVFTKLQGARLCGSYPQSLGRSSPLSWPDPKACEDKWDPTFMKYDAEPSFLGLFVPLVAKNQNPCLTLAGYFFWDFFRQPFLGNSWHTTASEGQRKKNRWWKVRRTALWNEFQET